MSKLISALIFVCLLIAYGCKEEAKKSSPASIAPGAEQGQDQHVSGDGTSADHVSGAPSSDSHLSGN